MLGRCIHIGMVRGNGDLDEPAQAFHIAHQNPARTLAMVAAHLSVPDHHGARQGLRDRGARMNHRNAFARCLCGHLWLHHDIEEYDGDGSDTCCVEGCDQKACPGRQPKQEPDHMDDLIAQIRAAIDEDERIARAASTPPWSQLHISEEDNDHVARHDPARVLRQVAAHRLELDSHQYDEDPWGCISCERNPAVSYTHHDGWCNGVLALADVYQIEVVVLG